MNQYEKSAATAGWYEVFGVWFHVHWWEAGIERATHWKGSARDLCLSQGLATGEG